MNLAAPANKITLALVASHELELLGLEALIKARASEFAILHTLRLNTESAAHIGVIAKEVDVLLLLSHHDQSDFLAKLQEQHPTKVIVISDIVHHEDMAHWHALMDRWVSLGVRGVLGADTSLPLLCKAITKVHEGELWLDRFTTARMISKMTDAHASADAHSAERLLERLTEREKTILGAIADGEGQALRDISQALHISEFTLRNHLTAIYSKLGVKNRLDLYVFASTHLKKKKPH